MAKKVTVNIINDEFLWKIFAEVQAAFEKTSKGYAKAIQKDKESRESNRWLKQAAYGQSGFISEYGGGLVVYKDANTELIVTLEAVIRQLQNQLAKVIKDRGWKAPEK